MTKLSHMELRKHAKGQAVVCQVCFHSTAHVQNGFLVITGRHGSQVHTNLITAEDLEELAKIVRESALKRGKMVRNKVA